MLDLELSPAQKKWATYAITCMSVCIVLAFIVFSIKIFGSFLNKYILVFAPLAISAILSVIIKPIIDLLSNRLRMSRTYACIATFAVLILVITIIGIIVLPKAISQIIALVQTLPSGLQTLMEHIRQDYPMLSEKINAISESFKTAGSSADLTENLSSILSKSLKSVQAACSVIISVSSAIAAFAVIPIYLFFMLISEQSKMSSLNLEKKLSFLKPEVREDLIFLVSKFGEIIITFFRGQILIAILTGLLLGFGLMFAGVKFGFIIGFTTGCINIIPYLGSIIGLSAMLPVSYFQDGGGFVLFCATIMVFVITELINAYILTPWIMGERTKLSPMLIIFSVFFWGTALGGIMGMLLAIPLTAFVKVFWDLASEKYIQPLFGEKNHISPPEKPQISSSSE